MSTRSGTAVTGRVTLQHGAVVAACCRAGIVLGLWPVLLGGGGILTENIAPLAVHVAGALATVWALVHGHRNVVLIALAYTGYSTLALGLAAPGTVLAVLLWTSGIATVVGCAAQALGGTAAPPPRAVLAAGAGAGLVLAVLVTSLGLAGR